MALSQADRITASENRIKSLEALCERLIEALNKCVTIDQVQQLEILGGSQIDVLTTEVENLRTEVELMRNQIFSGM